MTSQAHQLIVVGAGISGLAAAYETRRRAGDTVGITIVDAADRVGGKLALTEVGGITVDSGAESLLARRPEGMALLSELGLEGEIVHPALEGASLWLDGVLRPLPKATLLGIPQDLHALATSGVLSVQALLRVPLDRVLPTTSFDATTDDVAIGFYVSQRLGRQVVDRLVEPLLGGVYAGHADELSFAATLPQLARLAQLDRSLLSAAQQVRHLGARQSGPVFASLHGGMGTLPARLVDAARADVRLRTSATAIRARSDGRWSVELCDVDGTREAVADAVIVAVPGPEAARLMREVSPRAARDLDAIEYASVALTTFVLPRASVVQPLVGTGFLVPPAERRVIKASTFASQKWGWIAAENPERVVVRCSVGRFGETEDLDRDDDDLAWSAWGELGAATGLSGAPEASVVTRWNHALPQYRVGHLQRVARLQEAVAEHSGLALCGAAYEGVGIPACIGSGQTAALQVASVLASAQDTMGS
ncbi:MAG: protoporphyrinogen oxidase [Actinomycetes bacterium]